MTFDWIDLLAFYTLLQLLFLTFVIVSYKKGKRLNNLLLAGFMASNAFLITHALLAHLSWISPGKFTGLYDIGSSSYFLLMPFLYLYICSLCYDDFRLRYVHLFHLVPFTILVLISPLRYRAMQSPVNDHVSEGVGLKLAEIGYQAHEILLNLLILSYLAASAAVLYGYRKRLKELYSSIESMYLYWCSLLLVGFTAMWSIDVVNWLLMSFHASSPFVSQMLFVASLFVNLVFTLFITYEGLTQSENVSAIHSILAKNGRPQSGESGLSPADFKKVAGKLVKLMENDKLYLNPLLSVEDLSSRLNIPPRNLSRAIHLCFNKSFYDFVNTYRVEETKRRIDDMRSRELTLVAIAYDAGFNSKSVFNEAFKKHTGMTPKEYRGRNSR